MVDSRLVSGRAARLMQSACSVVEVAIQRASRPASGRTARLMQSARGVVEAVNRGTFCRRLRGVAET